MASTNATNETLWPLQLCKDFRYQQVKPTTNSCENQSCVALTQNPKFHARMKHVEIHHHFVHEKNA
jgi:hypothetical protein